jgi:hypothetical protein
MAKLSELAAVIRSKNAGPFELTLDVFFRDAEAMAAARESGVISAERIAALYRLPVADVLRVTWFAPAAAVKITLRRSPASADPGDTDVFGAQQHAPLLDLEIDIPARA